MYAHYESFFYAWSKMNAYRSSGAVGAQFLGGPKVQIFRRWDNFSDKTNSSEPPFNVLFLKVS